MLNSDLIRRLRDNNLLVFDEPNQVRIEFIRGCNLNCEFCGRSRSSKGAMEQSTLLNILNNLTEKTKRISVSLQGEPSLHYNLKEYLSLIREKLPKSQILMITNTEIYKSKGIEELLNLFDWGVNFIQADLYNAPQKQFFMDELEKHKKLIDERGIEIKDFYKDKIHAFSYHGNKDRTIIVTDESNMFNSEGTCVRRMHNWGGNLLEHYWNKYTSTPLKSFPLNKVCKEPMKYMTIGYDGEVDICCSSGSKSIAIGNVNTTNIIDIWQGDTFQQLRALLANGYRKDILSCFLCDQVSFRTGLYPYWGKDYKYEDCVETSFKVSQLYKKEPLYSNLLKYKDEYGSHSIPLHISQIIREAE